MAVVRAAAGILLEAATELTHDDHREPRRVTGAVVVAQIDEERLDAQAQFAQLVGEVAGAGIPPGTRACPTAGSMVATRSPNCILMTCATVYQLRPAAIRIDGAVARRVIARIGALHDVDGIERPDASLVEPRCAIAHGTQGGPLAVAIEPVPAKVEVVGRGRTDALLAAP